jgi:hypothetical protein
MAVPIAVFSAVAVTPGNANAQQVNLGRALSGLINVDVSNVNVELVDVVDVSIVLNNNQVDVLRNAVQRNPVASNNSNLLNDLLRDANLITDNQIIVGVLGGTFLMTDLAQ